MANFTILEPMSTGDVIDRALRLYRRNFAPLLSIVALPSLTGYLAQTMLLYGYTKLLIGQISEDGVLTPDPSPLAILMLILGLVLYPVWLFAFLATISGLSRVIGDNIMLNEPITFKKCFSAVRKRLGDIFLMALLVIVIGMVVGMIFYGIAIVVVLVVSVLVLATASSGIPAWLAGLFAGIVALVVIGLGIGAMLVVLSRVVFLPQIVMIEGQSPGQAISRAMQLGKGNWYKVGAILLFNYFISLSLLTAITLPVMLVLYFADILSAEFIAGTTWNLIYTSFSQLINLLSLPIQMVAFTLLYFDSRVRKEAYDIELLAREVNPGFYWQPQMAPAPVMGYQMPYQTNFGRVPVQTSPLGLAGWQPPRTQPPPVSVPDCVVQSIPNPMAQPAANQFTERWGQSEPPIHSNESARPPEKPSIENVGVTNQICHHCGSALEPNARFCIRCGNATGIR
ncbi:MAG: zinc-ribbon domain-containing protein [Acidobacteriota bacterium]